MLDNNHDGLIFHFCQLLLKMTCRRFKLFENILVCKLHIILSTENDQANSTQYLPWLSQQMTPPTQSHTPKTTSRHEASKNQIEHSIWDESLLFSNCARSLEFSSSSTMAGLSYHICGKLEVAFKGLPSSQHQHCTDEAQKAETVLSAVIYIYIYIYTYRYI